MKKKCLMRLLFSLLFLLTLSFYSSAQQKNIKVETNKNIEVICTIINQISQWAYTDSVSNPWMYNNSRLMRKNYNEFHAFGSHPAVVEAKKLTSKIGTGVYLLGLYYKDLPSTQRIKELPELVLKEIHPDKDSAIYIVDNFMKQVSQFYTNSRFGNFLFRNKHVYTLAISEATKNLPDNTFIPMMEAYYGIQKDGYHIIVMPFFKSEWGMGWEAKDKGKTDVFNIISPMKEQVIQNDYQVIQAGYDHKDEIRNWSIHEFGHSFVNEMMQEKYVQQINAYKHLFKPIKNNPQYVEWTAVFNEHLVRAGEIRIALKMGNVEESKRLYQLYNDWMYLDHFIEQLKLYENKRSQYKTINDFLPVLIQSLSKLT